MGEPPGTRALTMANAIDLHVGKRLRRRRRLLGLTQQQLAESIGIRFHATRGAMSVGESNGGLPPDSLVEKEPNIIKDFERVVDELHDPSPEAMVKVALAPWLAPKPEESVADEE